jgi:hypothetical protein
LVWRQHRSARRPVARFLVSATLVGLLGGTTASADTPAGDQCSPGETPHFSGDFARLNLVLADWQGAPTTCEFEDPPGSGDIVQRTTTGVAYRAHATGVSAFTTGVDHWALSDNGVVYWNGADAAVPDDAQPANPNPCIERHTCSAVLAAPTTTPATPQSPPVPMATAEPAYLTPNGSRTTAQLHQELATAGYAGPWDVQSMLAAYDRASPRIAPYADDSTWSCLPDNPACPHDPWWAESDGRQEAAMVTYTAIGTSFSTERRFGEAIDLLWQWPTGKSLLRSADRQSVVVITLDYDQQTDFATFLTERNSITMNRRIASGPTWMVATVLAHELLHAKDHADGIHEQRDTANCIAEETNAFSTERTFLDWLTQTEHPEGLPAAETLKAQLTQDQSDLAAQIFAVRRTPDLASFVQNLYADTCASG